VNTLSGLRTGKADILLSKYRAGRISNNRLWQNMGHFHCKVGKSRLRNGVRSVECDGDLLLPQLCGDSHVTRVLITLLPQINKRDIGSTGIVNFGRKIQSSSSSHLRNETLTRIILWELPSKAQLCLRSWYRCSRIFFSTTKHSSFNQKREFNKTFFYYLFI
jgi:hypothetical protein